MTRDDIPLGYIYDTAGRVLTHKTSTGRWREYTRDTAGRVLTHKTSTGDWYEYTYDTAGRELTHKTSTGDWYEYTRDTAGRVLTHKTSTGDWYEYTRDTAGRVLTYNSSTGDWQVLAIDVNYTLRYNTETGTYWAGCFKGTRDEAIERWTRTDTRAVLFLEAINGQGKPL